MSVIVPHHAPRHCSIEAAPVHIWWSRASSSPARVWKLYQTLSDDESARALRSVSEFGFQRNVCSWGVLREILSGYTGIEPERLRIEHGRSGKPYLPAAEGEDDLRFSLSQAGDISVYAVTWSSDIGVDVERVGPRHADRRLWESTLSQAELAALESLSEEQRPEAYARMWTRKESVLKATGRGLAYPAARLDTTTACCETGCRVDLDGVWHVVDVPAIGPGYVASIATRSRNPIIRTRIAPGQDAADLNVAAD